MSILPRHVNRTHRGPTDEDELARRVEAFAQAKAEMVAKANADRRFASDWIDDGEELERRAEAILEAQQEGPIEMSATNGSASATVADDERKAKNERLSEAMKSAWARRKAKGDAGPPRRAKPDLSGLDFTGHEPNRASGAKDDTPKPAPTPTVLTGPRREPSTPAVAEKVPSEPPKPATDPQTPSDAFDALSLELDAAKAIVDALGPLGTDARRRVANWILGAVNAETD